MKGKKTKLLITGPGSGHNIIKSLDFLNNCESFDTYFLTKSYSFDNRFKRIRIIDYYHPNKYFRLIKLFLKVIFMPRINILYMQDNMGYDFFILRWFLRYDKLIFNIWSEYIIDRLKEKGLAGIIARTHLNNADFIICTWHGTYNKLLLTDKSLGTKAKVLPRGLLNSFFNDEDIKSDFMKNLLNKISDDRFVLINMRSFSDYNAIEVLLDAIALIKKLDVLVFEKLLLIFWHGNNVDKENLNYIHRFIRGNKLENNVWCVEHPFLPESDIKQLIMRSNIVVNLVKHDQLSSSILEAMFLEKDLLCSDIEPYRILNDKHETKLNLINIDPKIVADEILRLRYANIAGNQIDDLKKHRKSIVEQYFSASKNQKNRIDFLKSVV